MECNLWKLQVGVHAAHSQSEALKPGGQSLPSHNESGTSLPGWLIGDAKACHVLVVLKVGAPLKHHKGFKYVKYVKTAIPWISWDDFTSMLGSAWPHGSSIFRKNLLWPWPKTSCEASWTLVSHAQSMTLRVTGWWNELFAEYMSTKESTAISCCLAGFLNPSPFLACAQLGDESHLPDTSCANVFLPSTALTNCSLCSSAARDKRLINKQIHQRWSLGSFGTCAYCALCFPPFHFEINQRLLHADHPRNQDRQSLPVLNIWKPP